MKKKKPTRKSRKAIVVPQPVALDLKPGDRVQIVRSSVNYAHGKIGEVVKRKDDGWEVRVHCQIPNSLNNGALDQPAREISVWASDLKYLPPEKTDLANAIEIYNRESKAL